MRAQPEAPDSAAELPFSAEPGRSMDRDWNPAVDP